MKVMCQRGQTDWKGLMVRNEVDVSDITGLHWDNKSGGYGITQKGYSLYGYISYALSREKGFSTSRDNHARFGNDSKIMIPASQNKEAPYKEGYAYLLTKVGEKPKANRSVTGRGLSRRVYEILEEGPLSWGELKKDCLMKTMTSSR